MTSKLTRERIELIANFHRAMTLPPSHAEIEELARMALAALDSEPVAYISKSDFDAGYPHILARRDFNKACTMPVYAAQPAPVVPEEKPIPNTLSMYAVDAVAAIAEVKGWNACRAALLQELKKSAGTEAICRSDENVQVLHTKSPAQSDCCPAQNHVSPEQNGDTPAQSQGWIQVSKQMPPSRHEVLVGRWWGEKPRWCCKWATYIPGHPDAQSSGWLIPGASWTPTHWMPLPAAPQEVKSES
ncbi:DUF551 domain-containing protein [Klebsiella pneumoniae]|uniref:DUF551 domain-containing protein n=1 Tax=Klebsiella pneumoniae TaxID=573 RepID=UPI00273174F9|nr:DUF551 domain-containing protein [Klebsiella pneumoniae]MDP0697840.1 DUF551 domain-containing protein [Klebsiella pneumoniae]